MRIVVAAIDRWAARPSARRQLFAFAVVVRLLLGFAFLAPCSAPEGDAIGYLTLADSIRHQGMYVNRGVVTAERMPGYPLFLLVVRAVFGDAPIAPRLVQVAIGAATVVAIFTLARALFGSRAAVIAGGIAALDPFLIFYDFREWSESPFIALCTWGLVHFERALRQPSSRSVLAGSAWLALAVMIRPDALFFHAAVASLVLVRVRPLARAARTIATLAALTLMLLLPWWVRNAFAFRTFIPLTTDGSFLLWQFNNEEVLYDRELRGFFYTFPGDPAARDPSTFDPDLAFARDPRFAGATTEVEQGRRMRGFVYAFWREHARELPELVLAKWARFFALSPAYSFWPPLFTWVSRAWYGLLLPAAGFGLAAAIARRRSVGLLVSVLAWFFVRGAVFTIVHRYRLQVEPALIVLAAYALASALSRATPRRDTDPATRVK